MEETISLKEIFEVVKKRLLLIVSFTAAAALIAAIVSFFILTPIYQSSTQFIVNQSLKEDSNQGIQVDTNTIRTNVELINTYNVIITSNAILTEVIDELKLSTSPEALAGNIQVSSEQNSQVVTVTVKDPDPKLATEIANTTVLVFQDRIPDLMNVDNVKILSEAVTKENPSPVEPKPTLNIAIAIVLGLMAGVGVAFLLEYLDTSVRTEQDVQEKLGLPILGVISTMEAEDIRLDPSTINNPVKQGGFAHVQSKKTGTQQ
ncbi:YveK family protein [Pseudogracilibacillus auburnensis]|uniref:Capsular polysaccharide biosynthesis protein n=1 Tax=Pseudogracilibacillus auburnensis TaxID=1494959 RepID=A0A2V3VYE6_9BACI|nr:Wzz/FepE/Etk N-terminal domain-containing protein [Pseudogracilibacillus auburnensis]PXW85944.1 capsular polysaccharide biosynthesis protein [Pseudogracilibacillus auburnensis]